MNTRFTISYHHLVGSHDIPHLSREWRVHIQNAIIQKLTTHPDVFGKPLRRSFAGYRKLRIGDYRAIFRIERNEVKIIVIGHRREVYRFLELRMNQH